MFLEGAKWDWDKKTLVEPESMKLFYKMPIINFKPVIGDGAGKSKAKNKKEPYKCPVYMYPIRTGVRERPSFMFAINLDPGISESDHWTKRGTALLMSLAD